MKNAGRLINFITGITGVSPGSQAVVSIPTNARYHRLVFQCTGVNYSASSSTVAQTPVVLTGSGTVGSLKIVPVIVNGVVQSATASGTGSGFVVGDTVTFADPTGIGFIASVATVSSGNPTAYTVVSGGTASDISPVTLITGIKLLVNGVNMRDIAPQDIIGIAQANGYVPRLGELPIFFTEPWRNLNHHNTVTSWDLFGQGTFQLQIGISSTVASPGLIGIQEFDYQRNLRAINNAARAAALGVKVGTVVPFLQPVSQHSFTWQLVGGRNDINNLPFAFPVSRIWLRGGTPGDITQLEIYADSNKVLEATTQQIQEAYGQYGFQIGNTASNGTVRAGATVPNGSLAAYPFDAAFISDPDQRVFEALKAKNTLIVRVYSAIAQPVTFVMESLPGAYQA